jgi:hypothetical protein
MSRHLIISCTIWQGRERGGFGRAGAEDPNRRHLELEIRESEPLGVMTPGLGWEGSRGLTCAFLRSVLGETTRVCRPRRPVISGAVRSNCILHTDQYHHRACLMVLHRNNGGAVHQRNTGNRHRLMQAASGSNAGAPRTRACGPGRWMAAEAQHAVKSNARPLAIVRLRPSSCAAEPGAETAHAEQQEGCRVSAAPGREPAAALPDGS